MSEQRRLTHRRLAKWLWEKDGRPDGYQLGEAHLGTYQREAEGVFAAIRALGFKVVPVVASDEVLAALKALRQNVDRDLSGFWTEGTANVMQQADAAIKKAKRR